MHYSVRVRAHTAAITCGDKAEQRLSAKGEAAADVCASCVRATEARKYIYSVYELEHSDRFRSSFHVYFINAFFFPDFDSISPERSYRFK